LLEEEKKEEVKEPKKPFEKPPSPWKYFGHYIRAQKALLIVGMISLFGSIIVDFSLPLFIGQIINCISVVDEEKKIDEKCI